MNAAVRITPADDGTFVLSVDAHDEQVYVTVGLGRGDVEQLSADLGSLLRHPALSIVPGGST